MKRPEETVAVRAGEEMDWTALEAYLRARMPELKGAFEVLQFPGGSANLTYLARFGDRELVVRRPPLGPLPKGGHDMSREHRVLSRLYEAYDRAPRAYLFCDDEGVIGAPFFVAERRRGVVVRDTWPEVFRDVPDVEERVGFALIDALAELHQVDPEKVGLADLGRPVGFVERQVSGWARRWEAAKDRDIPAFDEVRDELVRRMPANLRVSLLHNDFKLDNCQLLPSEPDRIHSVFDWDMATLGDPLVDLGILLGYWPEEGDAHRRGRMPPPLRAPFPPRAALVERYGERTGFAVAGIGWYEAFALWKTAVVVQQIYIRYKRGQTDDRRFAGYGERAATEIDAARLTLERL